MGNERDGTRDERRRSVAGDAVEFWSGRSVRCSMVVVILAVFDIVPGEKDNTLRRSDRLIDDPLG